MIDKLISYLNFIFAELANPHKKDAVHPIPIQLYNVHHHEGFSYPGRIHDLLPGIYEVALDGDRRYIIGLYVNGILLPFVAPIVVPDNVNGRVKIRLDGGCANEIVPILMTDPLNSWFHNLYSSQNIVNAELHD